MIACLDVHNRDRGAVAACVVFADWTDGRPVEESVVAIDEVEPYEPGRFFRRELPCLLAALGSIAASPRVVIIDGYGWLGGEGDAGLGAHLHEAIWGRAGVIGVAKTRFLPAVAVREVRRGRGHPPLYVSAVGIDVDEASRRIREMQGPFRIPILLRRVDPLSLGLASPS